MEINNPIIAGIVIAFGFLIYVGIITLLGFLLSKLVKKFTKKRNQSKDKTPKQKERKK